jgi:hypothetical protein
MNYERIIKISDSKGFVYEVQVKHSPGFGFSTAYYYGRIIAQVDEYKLRSPFGDDDREWEEYQERLYEFMDQAEADITPSCKEYFDKQCR